MSACSSAGEADRRVNHPYARRTGRSADLQPSVPSNESRPGTDPAGFRAAPVACHRARLRRCGVSPDSSCSRRRPEVASLLLGCDRPTRSFRSTDHDHQICQPDRVIEHAFLLTHPSPPAAAQPGRVKPGRPGGRALRRFGGGPRSVRASGQLDPPDVDVPVPVEQPVVVGAAKTGAATLSRAVAVVVIVSPSAGKRAGSSGRDQSTVCTGARPICALAGSERRS